MCSHPKLTLTAYTHTSYFNHYTSPVVKEEILLRIYVIYSILRRELLFPGGKNPKILLFSNHVTAEQTEPWVCNKKYSARKCPT